MKPAEKIEKLIQRLHFKTSAEMHERTLNDAVEAQAKSKKRKSAKLKPSIWRTIMKSPIAKLAAAVMVIAVLVGIYQVGGARAAFAETTKAVRVTLSRLKEFLTEIRTREAAPPPPIRRVRHAVRDVDTSKWSDIIQYDLFLVQGEQADLRNFFEKQDIEFTPTTNNPNICYAILDGDKADGFIAFSQSSDELKLLATPRLILRDGKEAMLGSADLASSGGLAFAVAGTLVDDNKHIDLSFSFYDGETGIEIPSIRIKTAEAVLIRAVKTVTATGDDGSNEEDAEKENDIFILIQMEVQ